MSVAAAHESTSPRAHARLDIDSTRAHVVTGSTGFVGAALVLELLDRTDDRIVAIVRAGDTTAEQRFEAALNSAADAYDRPRPSAAELARCTVVAGDLLAPAHLEPAAVAHERGVDGRDAGPPPPSRLAVASNRRREVRAVCHPSKRFYPSSAPCAWTSSRKGPSIAANAS